MQITRDCGLFHVYTHDQFFFQSAVCKMHPEQKHTYQWPICRGMIGVYYVHLTIGLKSPLSSGPYAIKELAQEFLKVHTQSRAWVLQTARFFCHSDTTKCACMTTLSGSYLQTSLIGTSGNFHKTFLLNLLRFLPAHPTSQRC